MLKRRKRTIGTITSNAQDTKELKKLALCSKLDLNLEAINKIFKDDETLVTRTIVNKENSGIKAAIVYSDGMVDNLIVNQHVIMPVQEVSFEKKNDVDLADLIAERITLSNTVEKTDDFEKLIQAIVYGDTVLFIDGTSNALILNTKGFKLRSIEEPDGERVLSGPREGFTEGILLNLSLVRRRLRTEKLKMKYQTFGTVSKTKACVCYIEGIADQKIVDELFKRLEKFNLDGALDVNYITEQIKDHKYSPFKTIGTTERPDVVAAKLLEGRVALFLDGTPVVLTLPFLFAESFQSSDDYYINFYYSTFFRILRYFGFFLAISVPALYVSITTYHHEMLPSQLLLSLSVSRQGVPLPTIIEAFAMLIVFELLRESGIRMNSNIGQALSIVGALVIGQAAVEAKLVSAPMIIVVGLTGITGLIMPRVKGIIILSRYYLLLISSFLGLYGYMIGLMSIVIYTLSLHSFGIRYMSDLLTMNMQRQKDVVIRAPWNFMKDRPGYIATKKERQNSNV